VRVDDPGRRGGDAVAMLPLGDVLTHGPAGSFLHGNSLKTSTLA
jgi:hypothetical protein